MTSGQRGDACAVPDRANGRRKIDMTRRRRRIRQVINKQHIYYYYYYYYYYETQYEK